MNPKFCCSLVILSLLTTGVCYSKPAPILATTPETVTQEQQPTPITATSNQNVDNTTNNQTQPDTVDAPSTTNMDQAAQPSETPAAAPEIKTVGKASQDGMTAAQKQQWMNIGFAAGAVVVATVALVLVSQNNGHRK